MLKANKILCVDDDKDDILFLSEAISEVSPETEVVHAYNAFEALNYLNGVKNDADLLPSLIVLDLNMPMVNGKETFERIKNDPVLLKVPVVVLTSSRNPQDKAHFKQHNVELFTKPENVGQLNRIVIELLTLCRAG